MNVVRSFTTKWSRGNYENVKYLKYQIPRNNIENKRQSSIIQYFQTNKIKHWL